MNINCLQQACVFNGRNQEIACRSNVSADMEGVVGTRQILSYFMVGGQGLR